MQPLFFSIIIPTLREEKYLPKLLKSLEHQSARNFEIIIIDGSSEDNTKEEALKFEEALPLRFFSVRKRNVSYQRNYGAERARGEFLVFLDADATVPPNFTEKLYLLTQTTKRKLFIPFLELERGNWFGKRYFNLANYVISFSQFGKRPISAGGCMFIEKQTFKSLHGFDEKVALSEDHDLVQRAARMGIRAQMIKEFRITFSSRRIEREGQMTAFYKAMYSLFYYFIFGRIEKPLFSYEMGGGRYKK